MNPYNKSAEETLLNSKPVLEKILEHSTGWGGTHRNLVRAHPNFFLIEKEKKFNENVSGTSEDHVDSYYCTPPCANAERYIVSIFLHKNNL